MSRKERIEGIACNFFRTSAAECQPPCRDGPFRRQEEIQGMNFEVHFSSAAQADINQIFEYISITLCSPIAAKNLMAKFLESVNTLSDFPDAFALCQDEPWIYCRQEAK